MELHGVAPSFGAGPVTPEQINRNLVGLFNHYVALSSRGQLDKEGMSRLLGQYQPLPSDFFLNLPTDLTSQDPKMKTRACIEFFKYIEPKKPAPDVLRGMCDALVKGLENRTLRLLYQVLSQDREAPHFIQVAPLFTESLRALKSPEEFKQITESTERYDRKLCLK